MDCHFASTSPGGTVRCEPRPGAATACDSHCGAISSPLPTAESVSARRKWWRAAAIDLGRARQRAEMVVHFSWSGPGRQPGNRSSFGRTNAKKLSRISTRTTDTTQLMVAGQDSTRSFEMWSARTEYAGHSIEPASAARSTVGDQERNARAWRTPDDSGRRGRRIKWADP